MHFVVGLGSGLNDYDVELYHVDGTRVHTFKGHDDALWALAVTPDGQHIISGADSVKVWSVASKSLVSTCEGHTDEEVDEVLSVAAMPDSQRILSGAGDGTVRVWLLDGTLKNTFKLHNNQVLALVAMSDNQHAISASYDETVKLFNVNDGAILRTFRHWSNRSSVCCLALLPDGLRFVIGCERDAYIAYHGLAP